MEAQSISVKRAEVELHNFTSFGEPERVIGIYAEENRRRAGVLVKHLDYLGNMTPFLEIGASAGHTSYMLVNEYGQQGFALDLSANALRYGKILMEAWQLERAPIRIAGDALNLPFEDGSLRLVVACQMLSQFQDIEAVFLEAKRVLQPGGVFLFMEEPIRRMLSLRLFHTPYQEQMKSWERKLDEWGLLGYLTKDVIGSRQEEAFGIRQNYRMTLWGWDRLIRKHFEEPEYDVFLPSRGWGERISRRIGRRLDRNRSDWVPARLLGGALAAVSRKPGRAPATAEGLGLEASYENLLRCPDCRGRLGRERDETLRCGACGYESKDEGGVHNLLPSLERRELYPGARPDVIDFSDSDCAERCLEGFYEVEGVYGNKYRWVGERARFRLERVNEASRRLRMRGFAEARLLEPEGQARIVIRANGETIHSGVLDRPGMFVIEAPLPPAEGYEFEMETSPRYQGQEDERWLTVNLSLMRLV